MNDAPAKTLEPQLARTALKKIANHKSTTFEPHLPLAHLVEKMHQEDITRTHIDRHKLSTNSTFSSSIDNISLDIDHLTVDDIHMMERDIAQGINVVRHKYSNDPKIKGKPLFLKFYKNWSRSGHSISTCPDKRYTKTLEKPYFQKQTFNRAMKKKPKSSKRTSHIKQYDR